MKTKARLVLLLGIVVVAAASSADRTDENELKEYCSTHSYQDLPGGLRFTKEVVSNEYASVKLFKAIHCCLRGYRSIEWYKDSRPYPWPGGESSFILYPESANQTIYTQEVKPSDAGRYSCRARNDTTTLEGDITLAILGGSSNDYRGRPLPTYRPSSQLVPLAGRARLFCEAYIGRAPMPDAAISVTWRKANSNATFPVGYDRISHIRASRDKGQIVGAYLVIEDVALEDYGEYICQISNGIADDEVKIFVHLYRQESQLAFATSNGSWHKSLLLSLLVLVLLLSAAAFFARCWLPLTLFFRDKFSPLEKDDGKDCDALVCYHEKDTNLAVHVVISTLETRHRYKCASLELSSLSEHWIREISPHAARARRVLVILSPESLSNNWTESNVSQVLKQLSSLSVSRTIVVALRDVPTSPVLAKSSRATSGHKVRTPELVAGPEVLRWRNERGFWHRLRLALPAARAPARLAASSESSVVVTGSQRTMIVHQVGGAVVGQQKARSRESLEVLV